MPKPAMRILLTGKNGQLGHELQRRLAPLGEVIALDSRQCDLSDAAALRRLVSDLAPQVIVNPAAYTAVDKAESEPDKAFAVNATAAGVLAEAAERLGALLIHYSTDYVFAGEGSQPYREDDATAALNVYGRSKCAGEAAIRAACPQHLILRTSWVVGAHGNNFAKTMLRLAAERDSLSVVADQWGAPSSTALLAKTTAQLLAQWASQPQDFPYGTYHLAAGGETNWCDYARFVIGEAIQAGRALKLTPAQIRAIASSDYPTPARRPLNSRLATDKIRETFGLTLPHWQEDVRQVLAEILTDDAA